MLSINIHAPRVWLYSKEVRYADVLIISRMPSTYLRSAELLPPGFIQYSTMSLNLKKINITKLYQSNGG